MSPSLNAWVPLNQVSHLIPLEIQSIYNLRQRRRVHWLEKRGKCLWVELNNLLTWAQWRGWNLHGNLHALWVHALWGAAAAQESNKRPKVKNPACRPGFSGVHVAPVPGGDR
jgi:fermentation-respiration switch protein FrsA (DUF1100 family)